MQREMKIEHPVLSCQPPEATGWSRTAFPQIRGARRRDVKGTGCVDDVDRRSRRFVEIVQPNVQRAPSREDGEY